MSIYDYPKYPGANVEVRQPGGSNAPATEYRSAPPRALPPHVQAANRRSIQIDAVSGQALYDSEEERLWNQADDVVNRKAATMAAATNRAIHDSPSDGGSLGAGLALAQPAAHNLPWLLHGAAV